MEEQKVIDMVVDRRTPKEKFLSGWYTFTGKVKKAGEWVAEHPVESMTIATLTIGGIAEGRRCIDRAVALHDARESRLTMYCNDIQGKVRLKHELNYKENLELRDLMDRGYTKFQALDKMKLLK